MAHRARKRKHSEPDLPVPDENDENKDIMFVAKVEPPEIKRNRLLKILIGDHIQFSTRGAVQDILKDPAYFHCGPNLEGDVCRILIPETVDPYATYVVLLKALNPGMPLDCNSTLNGLTLKKLHAAAKYLKIDGQKIGLQPLPSAIAFFSGGAVHNVLYSGGAIPRSSLNDWQIRDIQTAFLSQSSTRELMQLSLPEMLQVLRKDFLAVPCELDVYKMVKKWCEHAPESRETEEILNAVLAEIRWELLVDTLPALVTNARGPLKQALHELQQYFSPKPKLTVERRLTQRHFADSILVFFADRSQAGLQQYNWETGAVCDIKLPTEMEPWCRFKEMGPAIDGEHVLLRASSGNHVKTWYFSVVTKKVRYLFLQKIQDGAQYPLACIDGVIYAWDFQKEGPGNRSFKFHTERSESTSISQPSQFREQAAFETFNGKFYYCGGLRMDDNQVVVSTVEVYDAKTNRWSTLPDMQEPRRCFAAKVYNGYLYVTGGACNTGTGVQNSCERLNLEMPKAGWEGIRRLDKARYGHGMIIIKGQLYVCGGFTSGGGRADLERYGVQRDRWEHVCHVHLRLPGTSWMTFVMSYK